MTLSPAYGGGGAGFQLFVQSDNQQGIYADAAARDVYFGANPTDLARMDDNEFLIIKLLDNGSGEVAYQQRSGGNWLDVTSLVTGPDGGASNFTAITEGAIPSLSSDLINYENSGATRGADGTITFDNAIEVPSGSVKIGEVLELSEGVTDLVVVDLLNNSMKLGVKSTFNDSTGSAVPEYLRFGTAQTLTPQPVDTTVITTNPLTFSIVSTVVAPDERLIDRVIFRANGAMTNVTMQVVDDTTGLAVRYVPNKAAFEGREPGLDLIAGDNTFFLASNAADTPGNFHLGFVPFLTVDSQQLNFTLQGDSVDLLGNASDIPYVVIEAHDGPPTPLAIEDQANQVQTTGILEGGVISQASATTVDWTSGRGQVANYADPENVIISDVTWDAVAGFTPAALATDGTTIIGYDSAGSVVEKLTTAITILDAHDTIWMGSVTHISSTIIQIVVSPGNMGYNGVGSFGDFINLVIGPANIDGNIYGANGTNLNIDVTGGNGYMLGSNFRTDPKIPDTITLGSAAVDSFIKVYRSADPGLSVVYDGAATTVIDPTQYDDGSGTLQTVGPNNWTIQRLFRGRTGGTFVAYGQEEFNTKTLALEALGSEPFEEKSPLPLTMFRCSLVVSEAATDLSDTAEAEFFAQSSFRLVGAQSASATIPGITNPGGVDTSIQFNNANAFGGDAKFLFDSTLNTVVLQSDLAGSATYEFVDSTDDVKATIKYAEGIDEFSIDVLNGLSELHLNSTAFVHRGTNDGRIDIHTVTAVGSALLTLSNVGGGTGLSLEHNDVTDSSIIDSEIGDLDIKATDGSSSIGLVPDVGVGIGDGSILLGNRFQVHLAPTAGTGTAGQSIANLNLVGVGTAFLTEFVIGSLVHVAGQTREITSVTSDTVAVMNADLDSLPVSTQAFTYSSPALTMLQTGEVSIGTRTDPDSVLHIYEDTTETGIQAGLTIEQDGTGDAIAQFLLSGGQRWVTGIDNSGSDAFKIASSLDLASNAQLVLETNGQSEFLGSLGVNILPASPLHIYEDTATVGTETGVTIEQDGTGDAILQFLLTGDQRWVMGIDNSDDDNFVFAKSADLNSNQQLVLQEDGKSNFYGTLGVGKIPDDGYRLDVLTAISTVVGLSSFKAVTIESGKNGSGNSTDFFFNRGNVGFNQSEFTMFNDNNASGPSRMFRMGYSDDIDTSGGLTVWKTRNNVAVGTYSLPDSVFTVSEDTTETGDQAGLTIIQEGTGDAIAQFLLDGGQRWVMGIDNSGNDAFKIASSINLGSNDAFVIEPDAGAFLYSKTDDVLTLGNSTGETSKVSVDAGSPEGVVTGTGGDLHVNADSVRSTASLKKSTASSTADWYDFDLVPPNLKVIYNTTELEAMATFSVITISASTTWIIKGHLDSDVRIEFTSNATLHIVTDNSNQSSWTYSGTGTMFSGAGRLRSLEFMDLISSSTGTFCDLDLNGGSVNLTLAGVFGWDDLGTINNGTLILDVSDIFDNLLGWDLFNCKITLTKSNISNTPTTALPFLIVDNSTAVESKSISVDQMSGTFASGASLFRIEPALSELPKNLISACIFGVGELFDVSGTTGTFTVVADAAVPAEAITSVTDSSGVARFNFTAPPTLFVFQEVVISGFTTNTAYNGTYLITATGANYFEVASIAFGSDETGSFLSNSVTVTDTATTLVDGDQLTIGTDGSTDYDGGAIVYNQLTNTFQISRTFTTTHTGTWSTEGLDQTDPRILAQANPGFTDSRALAFGHIEANPIANTTAISVADVYQAIDITGTTGSVTVFATNGAGGTTCTSATHGLVENQNVVLTAGDEYYHGEFTIFNVLTNTFDIARTFQATVLTSTWTAGFDSDHERFKTIDPTVGLVEYIGNEPFEGSVKLTWSVYKSGSSEDYLFSAGKNGVAPEQGAAYQKRTVTTSTSVHPVTISTSLVKGDTIQPILASVTTTNSITVETLQLEIS